VRPKFNIPRTQVTASGQPGPATLNVKMQTLTIPDYSHRSCKLEEFRSSRVLRERESNSFVAKTPWGSKLWRQCSPRTVSEIFMIDIISPKGRRQRFQSLRRFHIPTLV
jgi:hypothetical protein